MTGRGPEATVGVRGAALVNCVPRYLSWGGGMYGDAYSVKSSW